MNDMQMQDILLDRRKVYQKLEVRFTGMHKVLSWIGQGCTLS